MVRSATILVATRTGVTRERRRAQRFHRRLASFTQPASFANVLLLAATFYLVFRRKRPRFLEHVAFSMHVVTFVLLESLLSLIALEMRLWLGALIFLIFVVVSLWQVVYLTAAIRRFYLPGRWTGWLLSAAAAFVVYALNTVT